MPGAVLIQQASGDCRLMLELSAARHAAYCARHGFNYWALLGDVQFERAPHWNKITLVRHALALGFDIVAWLDADTLIVRDDEDLRATLDGGAPLALALNPGEGLPGTTTHWNTGVMFLRNTPRTRAFFDAVWQAGPIEGDSWHEQARIHTVLPEFPDLVQRLDDRWNSTPDVNEVANPVIMAWHGEGSAAVVPLFEELRRIGAADARAAALASTFVHSGNVIESTAHFIATMPPPPAADNFHGRGLVLCGGRTSYFTCAWVAIHQLRRLGCTLPVQLWHLGQAELDDRMRALVAPLGVDCVDAHEVRQRHPARTVRGWELKAYSMLYSRFREVLLIDSDNVPVVNPEFLFDTPEFRDTGAVFWPDYTRFEAARAAWKFFAVPYRDEPEFESGQMLVDKAKCWRALRLAMWYNEYSDFFYRHVHGDKDTFRFAWHRLGQKYSMPPFPTHALEDTMCQHDFAGRRIFQHRNQDKWVLRGENKRIAGFLFEAECLADLARLRTLWDGKIQAA